MVLDPSLFEKIAQRVSDTLPDGAKQFQNDIDKNIRAALHGVLDKLDLVTREELDTQKAVLERTRIKLENMESRLAELEAALSDSDSH